MNKIVHPVEPEELMAYLDGELSSDRTTVATEHLRDCAECQTDQRSAECFSLTKSLGCC